jgi:hypothetical protein
MHPINEMSPMSSLTLPPDIANHRLLAALLLITRSFLIEKVVGQHDQTRSFG